MSDKVITQKDLQAAEKQFEKDRTDFLQKADEAYKKIKTEREKVFHERIEQRVKNIQFQQVKKNDYQRILNNQKVRISIYSSFHQIFTPYHRVFFLFYRIGKMEL